MAAVLFYTYPVGEDDKRLFSRSIYRGQGAEIVSFCSNFKSTPGEMRYAFSSFPLLPA